MKAAEFADKVRRKEIDIVEHTHKSGRVQEDKQGVPLLQRNFRRAGD